MHSWEGYQAERTKQDFRLRNEGEMLPEFSACFPLSFWMFDMSYEKEPPYFSISRDEPEKSLRPNIFGCSAQLGKLSLTKKAAVKICDWTRPSRIAELSNLEQSCSVSSY